MSYDYSWGAKRNDECVCALWVWGGGGGGDGVIMLPFFHIFDHIARSTFMFQEDKFGIKRLDSNYSN